jgi:hypothetical protein
MAGPGMTLELLAKTWAALYILGMKKFAHTMLSAVAVAALVASPALAETKKAEKAEKTDASAAAAPGKMDKASAEKAVMKKYPGAKIITCEMKTMGGKSGWVVKFTRTGGNVAEQVMVDDNGKLTRM